LRRARWVALVLLLLQGIQVAYGASPLASGHCACAHGPEIDCECPHHEGAGAEALPACHRRVKEKKRAEAADAPALRARCGSTGHALVLLTTVSLEQPWLPDVVARVCLPLPEEAPHAPPFHPLPPPRPPPRAQV
jgi:hypothetical protein